MRSLCATLLVSALFWYRVQSVLNGPKVNQQQVDSNDAAKEADTRSGHAPYHFQNDLNINLPQGGLAGGNGLLGSPGDNGHGFGGELGGIGGGVHAQGNAMHLPGAAAQLAHQFQANMQNMQGAAQKEVSPEYVTYQYQGQHEEHQRHEPPPPPHFGPNEGGYGLPHPIQIPVHNHHHHEGLHEHHPGPLHHVGHHGGHHGGHHLQIKKLLVPLAGIALIGAAAVLATNPVLLQLGVVTGKRRRRRAASMPMEHRAVGDLDELLETTTMSSSKDEPGSEEAGSNEQDKDIEDAKSAFANLTKILDSDNEVGVRLREIMVLEEFLKQQSKQTERRSGPLASADGALASLLSCSGLLNAQSSVCLQRMACEAYSEETDLPTLELQVIKIVLHELVSHNGIPEAVKLRLRAAVSAGVTGHRCEAVYRCPDQAWSRCTDPEPQAEGVRHQL